MVEERRILLPGVVRKEAGCCEYGGKPALRTKVSFGKCRVAANDFLDIRESKNRLQNNDLFSRTPTSIYSTPPVSLCLCSGTLFEARNRCCSGASEESRFDVSSQGISSFPRFSTSTPIFLRTYRPALASPFDSQPKSAPAVIACLY